MNTFHDMGLGPDILKALDDLNFVLPTPIQAEAIPYILKNETDLLGFAQTGTGKTAAFSLPIVEKINPERRRVQALILCPTRELCMQITRDMDAFTKYSNKVNAVAIYGGSSSYQQIKALEKGAQIVVGTPGRVTDLIRRGKLDVSEINWLVLDEADDMLDKGFKEELDAILDSTPEEKQTLLFSATMSSWIRKVANERMHSPKEIKTASENKGADTVEHQFVMVHARDRYAALRRLLDVNPDVYGIVFCKTRRQTKEISAQLITDHYSAEAIHGDMSQDERSDTMQRFRNRQIQIMVATDVAARGIDVNELTHVINFELPDSPETYVHRSGRTGRAGNLGISLSIIHLRERGRLKRIEGIMKKRFNMVDIPKGKEICEAQLMSLVKRVKSTDVDMENLAPYLPTIYDELQGLSYEELIQHFVSVEFNRFLDHYSNVKDLSTQKDHGGRDSRRGGDRRDRGGRDRKRKDVEFNTYQINFGKKDGFNPKELFKLINKNQSLKGIEIGGIQMDVKRTQFEADRKYHKKILRFLDKEKFKKRPVVIREV